MKRSGRHCPSRLACLPPTEGYGPMSIFPPVADYAFLSNCEQSCLVAPDGSVEWLCLPRPDSPSVFGALLDRTAGGVQVRPGQCPGAASAQVRPGHHGARDDLACPCRLAGRS